VSPNDRAVDEKKLPRDASCGVGFGQQAFEKAIPEASAAPHAKALVDGLPSAEALRAIAPRSARVEDPKKAIDDAAVVFPLPAATAVDGEDVFDALPLRIAEGVTAHGDLHSRYVAM
jgi:hypothetical protein